jgi:hypothetical protein
MVELVTGFIEVFADTPLTGNPLGVVQGADSLTGDEMRWIAGEFNQHDDAIKILYDAAEELRNIYRGKHYALWREDTAPQIDNARSGIEPFKNFRDVWIAD